MSKTFGSPIVAPRSFGYVAAPLQIGQPPIPSALATPIAQPATLSGNTLSVTLDALPPGESKPIVGLMFWYGDIIPAPAPPLTVSWSFTPEGVATPVTQAGILVGGGYLFAMPFNENSGRRVVTNAQYSDLVQPSISVGGVTPSWARGSVYVPAPGDGLFELVIAARRGDLSVSDFCAALAGWTMDNCGSVQTGTNFTALPQTGCAPPVSLPRTTQSSVLMPFAR